MSYKIAIVTQTPLIKFNNYYYINNNIININDLKPNEYQFTVGGVSNMEKVLIKKFLDDKFAKKIYWFSLNPNAPENIVWNKNIRIFNLKTSPKFLKNYTEFKNILWDNIHGIDSKSFSVQNYLGYLMHNWIFTKKILEKAGNFDVYYIHDFQQLMMGSLIGPMKPAILRWHVPFIPENFNDKIKKFIKSGLEGFDGIIVSTKRDLEGLIRAGFNGLAFQVYPHIDPNEWKNPNSEYLSDFVYSYNIKDDDFLILNVARMDRMKSQDLLIKAFAKFNKKVKNGKLMLIGNGSFTSSSSGLKSNKGKEWRNYLEKLAEELKIKDKIIFTGYLPTEKLYSAYKRADLFVLPSIIEGFGLTVIEAWLYEKCAIVSNNAGVAELISEDVNGLTFHPQNINDLYEKMLYAYLHSDFREDCGKNARHIAKSCYISNTEPKIKNIINKVMDNFRKS